MAIACQPDQVGIEWTYDANGTKLKKTTSAGNTKDYAGNVEYEMTE